MSDLPELARLVTATVVIPIGVFGANWFHRAQNGYTQTAAADFLLAVLIFDAALVITAKEFEPFVRNPELRTITQYWHVGAFVVSGAIWMSIVRWGEPALAAYYRYVRPHSRPAFPWIAFALCWVAIIVLIVFHVRFFVANVGGLGG